MPLIKTTYQRLVEIKRYIKSIDDSLLRADMMFAEKNPQLKANLETIRKDVRSAIAITETAMEELNLPPNA